MNEVNFIGIAGSLRKGSFNRSLLQTAQSLFPKEVNIDILDIGNLPHFNEDLEEDFPEEAQRLKQRIENTDGIIVATPEYNRSVPGVLKNAIDWTSRPYGENLWVGKPVYVIGATIGPIATAIAQSHLKHTMLYLNALVLGQPEFYLGNAYEKFDDNGKLTDEDTREFLSEALDTFVEFVDRQESAKK